MATLSIYESFHELKSAAFVVLPLPPMMHLCKLSLNAAVCVCRHPSLSLSLFLFLEK